VMSLAVTAGSVELLLPETEGAAVAAAGAVLAALGTGELVIRAARRKLGGITGDVLGCSVELGLAAALLVLALAG
jgi:adenosylcobinamide-GDP ribazoletransferase